MSKTSRDARHVRLYEWMLASAAWQSLDVYERQLYVEFKRRYNGTNNGDIAFSGDEMAAKLNCSNRPADRALVTLIKRGFVEVSRRGSFDWKRTRDGKTGGRRSSTYTLTEFPIDFPHKVLDVPSKDFMKWRSPADDKKVDEKKIKTKPKNKTRGDESTPLGRRDHPIDENMGVREHPNGVRRAPDKGENADTNGVRRAPASNMPLPAASTGGVQGVQPPAVRATRKSPLEEIEHDVGIRRVG